MPGHDDLLSEEQQLRALGTDVMRAYAAGDLPWGRMREQLGILDFGLVLRRLGEENLRLPRASADRPTFARAWLREVLHARPTP